MPIAVWRPAPVSARPPIAFVGGPSGEPVMLIAPDMACAIHSKLLYSEYGPPLPKPFTISLNIAQPRGALRLSVTPFLQEFSRRKNHASSPRLSESAVRPGSPAGGSILMTSAPSHAS